MKTIKITKGQIVRLQILYGQFASKTIGQENTREARLAWASAELQRPLASPVRSFGSLTFSDAGYLIDELQTLLGVAAPPRLRRSHTEARRAGLDGRKGGAEFAAAPQMASAEDLDMIARFYQRLGWDRARFDAFLASDRSPLGKRANPAIRTSADANRVIGALKRMLDRQARIAAELSAAAIQGGKP